MLARLPRPLMTLHKLLKVFQQEHPQFNLHVKIKGVDNEQSESNEDIEKMYQKFDSQVLHNPVNKFKAMKKMMQKGPNTAKIETKLAPGVSENSKAIKKSKKKAPSKSKDAKLKKEAQNADASLEEGEEGMIMSDAEINSHLSGSSDSDFGENPTEKKLIEKYDKYPEYLKISFKKPESFFQYTEPFNSANLSSIGRVLSVKSKEHILNTGFPFSFYI